MASSVYPYWQTTLTRLCDVEACDGKTVRTARMECGRLAFTFADDTYLVVYAEGGLACDEPPEMGVWEFGGIDPLDAYRLGLIDEAEWKAAEAFRKGECEQVERAKLAALLAKYPEARRAEGVPDGDG